jgi:hypothetical protein
LQQYDLLYVMLLNSTESPRSIELAVTDDETRYGPWSVDLDASSGTEGSTGGERIPDHQAYVPAIWTTPAAEYEVNVRPTDSRYEREGRWATVTTAAVDGSLLDTTHFSITATIVPKAEVELFASTRRHDPAEAADRKAWVRNHTDQDRFENASRNEVVA